MMNIIHATNPVTMYITLSVCISQDFNILVLLPHSLFIFANFIL